MAWTSQKKSVNSAKKNALKISKIANFESYLLKTNEDTAPQTSEFSQLGSYIFARVGSITFKLGNFTNVKRSFH